MPKEAIVLKQCKDLLKLLQLRGALYFKRVSTTGIPLKPNKIKGAPRFRKNEGSGIPDLIILLPHGKTLWCECKSDSGRPTVAQVEFSEACKAYGHFYKVTRSLDDLIAFLKLHGVRV